MASRVSDTVYYRVHVYEQGAIFYEYTGTETQITKALLGENLVFV